MNEAMVPTRRLPWLLAQEWSRLLFAHWPVEPGRLARFLPGGVEPGVWFLSLDASSPFFVRAGRALYGLPYRLARMTTVMDEERTHYLSTRRDACFAASYEPSGPLGCAQPGSLEHFLVERYRLFS